MTVFYATLDADSIREYIPETPVLLPASSWAGKRKRQQEKKGSTVVDRIPVPVLPQHLWNIAVDSGGFVATVHWKRYLYSFKQYRDWVTALGPCVRWAATMDYCCEPPITHDSHQCVRQRQMQTTLRAWQAWSVAKYCSWTWVPTIQGWDVSDYQRHARQLRPLIMAMRRFYQGGYFRIGIGTLCCRKRTKDIVTIVKAVLAELPADTPVHLWGVKQKMLRNITPELEKRIVSVDSAAWNSAFGSSLEKRRNLCQVNGWTQREYNYRHALPNYMRSMGSIGSSLYIDDLFDETGDNENQ